MLELTVAPRLVEFATFTLVELQKLKLSAVKAICRPSTQC